MVRWWAWNPDAERLFFQVEELLKEVRLPEKKKERIDTFLREVNQRVLRVPSTPKTEVRQVM